MNQIVPLGDLIKRGDVTVHNNLRAPLNSRQRAEKQGEYPYYGATSQMDSINEYKFDGFYILVAEDGTVYGSNGVSPMIQRVRGKFWVSNHAHVLQGLNEVDTKYLALALESSDVRSNITGAVQLKLSKNNLLKLKVHWPDSEIRKEILSYIDSIDEKIELNRQMSETLEQMGQALFRHYFIDNPEAEKWEDGKFSDVANILTGKGSVKSQMSESGKVPLYGANGIMGTSEDYLYDEPLVITGRVGTLGKVRAVTGQAWFSDNVLIIKPMPGYFGYVLRVAKAFDYISMNRGSSQPLITQTDLRNRQIKLPDDKTLLLFESQHKDIFDMQQKNEEQIQTLTTLRDTLLPRLISGKVKA